MCMSALLQVSSINSLAYITRSGFNSLFYVFFFFFLMKICFGNGLLSIRFKCLIFSLHNTEEEIQ